ncbi:MAG: EF-P lysine aminoacylase GenX [Deltaproteobacteria bacterium]|nr:EF-P lysine aminoacylase GenX [Deltaproteobacteria bacterium]
MSNRQKKIKKNLELRANIIQAVRSFFTSRKFLEVETPVRIPCPLPEVHIDAPGSGTWFLHTSPEACMKHLVSSGYQRIFQICKCFRENERGERHLPELTMLEWYCAFADYFDLMDQCEDLIRFVVKQTGDSGLLKYQGKEIDIAEPWERLSVKEAFDRYASVPLETALLGNDFDEIISYEIEPNLGRERPLFLYDYPYSKASLARLKHGDSKTAERFEMYIAGVELCNAFSELTDPVEQRKRFEADRHDRILAGKTDCPMPEKFLKSLEVMPPAAGCALGIDRLVMIFADTREIDDVVSFVPEEL